MLCGEMAKSWDETSRRIRWYIRKCQDRLPRKINGCSGNVSEMEIDVRQAHLITIGSQIFLGMVVPVQKPPFLNSRTGATNANGTATEAREGKFGAAMASGHGTFRCFHWVASSSCGATVYSPKEGLALWTNPSVIGILYFSCGKSSCKHPSARAGIMHFYAGETSERGPNLRSQPQTRLAACRAKFADLLNFWVEPPTPPSCQG